jgi:hypothetical protein
MSNTRELVDALISGDSIAIENSFNTVMSDKVSQALDSYRINLSQQMFDQEESEENTDDNSEQA